MSRDLPYFKFFTGEWLNGDITLEDYELQGIFINLCAYYWHRDGEVDIVQAEKKLRTDRIVELMNVGLVKESKGGEHLIIEFLDEQFSEFKSRKKKLSDAGKKGAKLKKEKSEKQPPFNHPSTTREDKDKIREDKDKDIEGRKLKFAESLKKYLDKYDKEMLNEFYSYWSEHGENDKKMRFEKQTSFSIARRLGTWKSNQKKYESTRNPKSSQARTTQAGRQEFD